MVKKDAKKEAPARQRSDSLLEEVRLSKEGKAAEVAVVDDKDQPAVMKKGFWKSFAVRAQMATLMMLTFMAIVRRPARSCPFDS